MLKWTDTVSDPALHLTEYGQKPTVDFVSQSRRFSFISPKQEHAQF